MGEGRKVLGGQEWTWGDGMEVAVDLVGGELAVAFLPWRGEISTVVEDVTAVCDQKITSTARFLYLTFAAETVWIQQASPCNVRASFPFQCGTQQANRANRVCSAWSSGELQHKVTSLHLLSRGAPTSRTTKRLGSTVTVPAAMLMPNPMPMPHLLGPAGDAQLSDEC